MTTLEENTSFSIHIKCVQKTNFPKCIKMHFYQVFNEMKYSDIVFVQRS